MRGSGCLAKLCRPLAEPLPGDGAPCDPADPHIPPPRKVGRLHGSVPNLSRYLEPSQSQLPFSLPPEYSQLQRSFWVLAQKGGMEQGGAEPRRGSWWWQGGWSGARPPAPSLPAVHGSLSSVVAALTAERARLEEMRQVLDRQRSTPRPGSAGNAGVRDCGRGEAEQGCPQLWVPPEPGGCCCWGAGGCSELAGSQPGAGCPGSSGMIPPPLCQPHAG